MRDEEGRPELAFAHPVERELAGLYDAYGIAWRYEPHTIVLERHEDGTVREAFTPDFYLPELDLYVECTVARQSLTHRKRRKARKARERGVTVGILFRRDFLALARLLGHRALERATRVESGPRVWARLEVGIERRRAMGDHLETTPAGDFWITSEIPHPGVHVLTVRGDADLHTAPELRERLGAVIDDGAASIVLDLSETTFLDSMSLGVLLGAMKRMRARQGVVRLVVTRPDVRRIFEITLLDRVFTLDDSREAALHAVTSRGLEAVEAGADLDHGVEGGDLEDASDTRIDGDQ